MTPEAVVSENILILLDNNSHVLKPWRLMDSIIRFSHFFDYYLVVPWLLSYTMHSLLVAVLVDERRNLWNASAHPEYPQHKSRDNHLKEDFEKFMNWQVYGICCFFCSAMMSLRTQWQAYLRFEMGMTWQGTLQKIMLVSVLVTKK